jgi:hypothetical protein
MLQGHLTDPTHKNKYKQATKKQLFPNGTTADHTLVRLSKLACAVPLSTSYCISTLLKQLNKYMEKITETYPHLSDFSFDIEAFRVHLTPEGLLGFKGTPGFQCVHCPEVIRGSLGSLKQHYL